MNYIMLTEEELLNISGGGLVKDFFDWVGARVGDRMNTCDIVGYTAKGCNPYY